MFGLSNAQSGFSLGAHVGLPTGDASDGYSFVLGVDGAYRWPVAAEFNLGLATGYSAWLGKTVKYDYGFGMSGEVKVETLSMVPLAASAQYMLTPQFSLGVDLGYGFLFASGESDGGFYYQPKAAYHFGPSQVNLAYAGVSKNGATISSINLGYAYTFGK
ncbi:hypothetical protein [Epilithonimonas sp.]|uniref:hypothetical protein n=1 Tax=Epilithonimonas sp. TaxID=2894511 RepID=UPI0035B478C7